MRQYSITMQWIGQHSSTGCVCLVPHHNLDGEAIMSIFYKCSSSICTGASACAQ